jgi:hypothetical protein
MSATYKKTFISLIIFFLFALQASPRSRTGATDHFYPIQNQIMIYVQQVKEGIHNTNYDQVVSSLQQLDELYDRTLGGFLDPLSPLYELIQALNIPGREYFLVPELKLYLSQVAYRYAQQTFRIVYETRQPISKESKEAMRKQLAITLRLLDPTKEPITPVIFNLRYIVAVVDNLPDTNILLDESTTFLLNLFKLVQSIDLEAGFNILDTFIAKGQSIYRGKQVEQITIVEALEKGVWLHEDLSLLDALQDLYKKTQFEEVRYATIQALGRISRAYYGTLSISHQSLQASKKAFMAFSLLLSAAIPNDQDDVAVSDYVRSAAVFELILLQNLLDTEHSQVVERYLKEVAAKSGQNKSWLARLKAKMSIVPAPNEVQSILANRPTVFRMSNVAKLVWKKPVDPIQMSLERIEQQQQAILKVLQKPCACSKP